MWHAWERTAKMYRFLVGNPEGKTPLIRPRRRWEDRIAMNQGDWLRECRVDRVGSG
jgi:uncharacterized short protein YbdD (DUF466 family)